MNYPCENCIVDMMCKEACDQFYIKELNMEYFETVNRCLRLMNFHKQSKEYKLLNYIIQINNHDIRFFNKNGKHHRENGPAVINSNGDQAWYKNGKCHREDGPAVIYSNGDQSWYINGRYHREDGPAVIYSNGYKAWYKNGILI